MTGQNNIDLTVTGQSGRGHYIYALKLTFLFSKSIEAVTLNLSPCHHYLNFFIILIFLSIRVVILEPVPSSSLFKLFSTNLYLSELYIYNSSNLGLDDPPFIKASKLFSEKGVNCKIALQDGAVGHALRSRDL